MANLQSRTDKDIKKHAQWKCFCTSVAPFCVPSELSFLDFFGVGPPTKVWGAARFRPEAADRWVPFKERKGKYRHFI